MDDLTWQGHLYPTRGIQLPLHKAPNCRSKYTKLVFHLLTVQALENRLSIFITNRNNLFGQNVSFFPLETVYVKKLKFREMRVD